MAPDQEAVRLVFPQQQEFAMNANWYLKCAAAPLLAASMLCCAYAYADQAPAPSKRQMMKDCMAKQKASDSGRHTDEMKKSCRDVTKTEKQNADQASAAQDATPHN
jgi:hypothetical protein